MTNDDIIGRWDAVAWRQDYDDGRVIHPMGEHPGGFVIYDRAGRLAVLLARRGRERFVSGGQWDSSDAEKARAYNEFMCYAGTYEIQGDEVIHKVEFCLYPNWEGGAQRRKAIFRDGMLHLIARLEAGTPEARTATMSWKRADS